MSTNPTPTAKPTPAELADWLDNHISVSPRDLPYVTKTHNLTACSDLIRELSAKIAACEALAAKWDATLEDIPRNMPEGVTAAFDQLDKDQQQLRAALSLPPINSP